jgi:hypothetical protein
LRRAICAAALHLVRDRYSWAAATERIGSSLGLSREASAISLDGER